MQYTFDKEKMKQRLADILNNPNVSKKEIAEKIGKSYRAVCSYANKKTLPAGLTIFKLAEHLNLSIDYIFGIKD